MTHKRYEKYVDTQEAWLGSHPSHWGRKPLWTLFRRVKRQGFESEELLSVYRDHGVIPKCSREDNFNKPSDDLGAYQLVEPGDLAVNKMKAWQGSVAISEHRGIVSPAYHVYRPLHSENQRFLHYLMRCDRYITGYLSISKGIRVNQWDLQPEYHSRMPVLLPPLDEQVVIASFLDRETAKIDALIAEQQRLIELLQEKRQAVISQAVTKGLNPNAPMKDSGVDWLGEVPEHWEVIRLKYLTQGIDGVQMGPFGALLIDLESQDTGYKVYGQENIIKQNLELGSRWISKARFQELERYTLRIGDIAVTRKGSLGNALLIQSMPQPGIGDSDTIRIRCDEERLNPKLLASLLHEADYINQQLIQLKRGSVLPGLNTETIRGLVVAIPQLHEQKELLSFINAICEEIQCLASEATAAESLLKERRSALISAAVTGQIDVRGLVEEEAVAQ